MDLGIEASNRVVYVGAFVSDFIQKRRGTSGEFILTAKTKFEDGGNSTTTSKHPEQASTSPPQLWVTYFIGYYGQLGVLGSPSRQCSKGLLAFNLIAVKWSPPPLLCG
mmetsp:Transcript_71255/g.143462  ORF Transcript_71255/g.143462 Transcript_71255/m.143462 type:complete len:108 (+) Transcript_71255:616-939(+)